MTDTLSDAEVKRLAHLGDKIAIDLQCGECGGIPCRTCRIALVENMKEYIRIQEGDSKIRILMEIYEYLGLDGQKYGPYMKGETVKIPAQEAEWLIKARIAEAIE